MPSDTKWGCPWTLSGNARYAIIAMSRTRCTDRSASGSSRNVTTLDQSRMQACSSLVTNPRSAFAAGMRTSATATKAAAASSSATTTKVPASVVSLRSGKQEAQDAALSVLAACWPFSMSHI